jgi:hypothetical protein
MEPRKRSKYSLNDFYARVKNKKIKSKLTEMREISEIEKINNKFLEMSSVK